MVLFTLEDSRYGIWKDQILSVEEIQSLHRLPFARSSLTVLSVIGGRVQTLADLPLCLGHAATRDSGGARALLVSEKEPIRGFLVSGELAVIEVSQDPLIPTPEYLRAQSFEGFFRHDSLPVPVINVSALYARIYKGERDQAGPPLALRLPTPQSPSPEKYGVFAAAERLFAAPHIDMAEVTMSGRNVARFPLLPPNIAGIAVSQGSILPVVDLTFRVSGERSHAHSSVLTAAPGGTALGFLIDEVEGEWPAADVMVKELPPIVRASWMSSALLRGTRIASLLDLGALLPAPGGGQDTHHLTRLHSPDSKFSSIFGHQAVEVTEFGALGSIFAVPNMEVEDVLPVQPFQEFPLSAGIVAGLAEFDGEIVPVLDLARLGGERPHRTSDWRMIVLKNGIFRALVLCEKALPPRMLGREVQRQVPVVIPLPVVYGCYTDGEAVRLVLNVEQLAVHYHQSGTAVLLPTFTGMARKNQADSRTAFDLKVAAPVTASAPLPPQPAPPAAAALPEPAPLAVSPVASPSAFSTLSAQVEIVASPAEPGPTPDLFVPTEATPRIGDEDLLEPALAPGLSEMSIPVRPGSGGLRQEETRTASASKQGSPAQGRTIRRALYAAAIVILLAAGVIAGLLPGAHRPGSAAPAAKEPEIATNTIPSNTAPTEYVVKTGDTLWDIAAQFTGDAHNYSGIAGYNGITDPNLISPGQVLRLPPDFNKKPGAPTP